MATNETAVVDCTTGEVTLVPTTIVKPPPVVAQISPDIQTVQTWIANNPNGGTFDAATSLAIARLVAPQ